MGLEQFSFLAQGLPGFRLKGEQVRVIYEPKEFYQELLDRSSTSRKRVVLSALYLGTGEKEKSLVSALHKNLAANQELRIKILLDWCRGTRLTHQESSATMLANLARENKERCQISMYHTPHLRGLYKRFVPARWNETIGLQHCKIYIFDDTLIISGANLSADYFDNRQDRYVLVDNCGALADYYEQLVSTVSDFSLRMDEHQAFTTSATFNSHPFEQDVDDFVAKSHKRVMSFMNSAAAAHRVSEESMLGSDGEGGVDEEGGGDEDTWIFPSVQMGPLGVQQDSQLTERLLRSGQPGGRFCFGSGYFNLTENYLHEILHGSSSDFDIIMAHPTANGFLGARGLAGGIPFAYTHIARGFWELVSARRMTERIRMWEYQRPGWTFHAKGLWYYQPGDSLPTLTMVGSSNFGYRSVYKDLETQLTIVTRNKELQQSLHKEQLRMFDCSQLVTRAVFNEPSRLVPAWVKLIVGVARHYF